MIEKIIKSIKPKHYWLLAFCLSCLTYALMFSYMGMLGNGKYIIARSDLKQQYLPIIQHFCEVIKGEHDYWFSWAQGMGTGTALTYAYYALSPFNIIFLLLGNSHVLSATALVIVLKAGTAAATFQIFLNKLFRKTNFASVLFAMMYALCGFQVCYYFNIIWIDALYMLPIISIGILRLVKQQKVGVLLFSYAYVFFCNFYMGYIVGISSFFLFIFYLAYRSGKENIRTKLKILCLYGLSVVGAALATAVVWLPAAIQLFSNMQGGQRQYTMSDCNPIFIINNLFMGQMQSLQGVTPFVYSGLLSALLLPFFFLNPKINKKKKIFGFGILFWIVCLFLIKPLNMIMHAFDSPEFFEQRFSYMFSFVVIILAYYEFMYIRKITKRQFLVMGVLYASIFAGCHFLYDIAWIDSYNANTICTGIINAFFCSIWILLIMQYRKRKKDKITIRVAVTFILMLELGINAAICMNRMEHGVTRQEDYEIWTEVEKNTVEAIKEDESFYRILYLNPRGQNSAFTYDYNSVTMFNSTEHAGEMGALEKLGFMRGVHLIRGTGSTPVTRALLDIKYIVNGMTLVGEIDQNVYQFYETNQRVLSLGYMVDEQILDYIYDDSPFVNQDKLLSCMTGEEINCFEKTGMKMEIQGGFYQRTEEATYLSHEENAEGEARFTFEAENDGRDLYVYFSQDRYVDATGGAEIPGIETSDTTSYGECTVFEPQLMPARIIPIGINKNGKFEFTIVMEKDLEADYYNKAYFCYYDDSEFQKAYDMLKQQQLEVGEYRDGYLKGEINVTEEGVMFTSIPYDTGWKVWVDGEETKTIPLLDRAFLGIRLEKGVHNIEMKYEAPGVRMGVTISILTILTIFMLTFLTKFNEKAKKVK